jgi:anti-sigma factor RsiW
MRQEPHLSDGLLVKALDGELTGAEKIDVEIHLADCQECLDRLDRWADFSTEIARVVDAVPAPAARHSHERLLSAMADAREPDGASAKQTPWRRTLAWVAALAACLTIVSLFSIRIARHSPKQDGAPAAIRTDSSRHSSPAAIAHVRPDQPVKRRTVLARNNAPAKSNSAPGTAADGFWPLPYSNPALPVDSADVLRVRVRLSALTEAGVVTAAPAADDPWVQADVLLGADGEPRGIRLLQASATE